MWVTIQYKISDINISDQVWAIKQFADRDQFPSELEKTSIGSDLWGADVPESLWPLSGILWPSGVMLAQLVLGLNCLNKKILEIGCGVGLASLVLKSRGYDVTASDYNQFAGELLRENAQLNHVEPPEFRKLSWQDRYVGHPFDLIIGSDVLYEPGCAQYVCIFLQSALAVNGEALFVDPGRAHVRKFETTLEASGFKCSVEWPVAGEKMRILRISKNS